LIKECGEDRASKTFGQRVETHREFSIGLGISLGSEAVKGALEAKYGQKAILAEWETETHELTNGGVKKVQHFHVVTYRREVDVAFEKRCLHSHWLYCETIKTELGKVKYWGKPEIEPGPVEVIGCKGARIQPEIGELRIELVSIGLTGLTQMISQTTLRQIRPASIIALEEIGLPTQLERIATGAPIQRPATSDVPGFAISDILVQQEGGLIIEGGVISSQPQPQPEVGMGSLEGSQLDQVTWDVGLQGSLQSL
jgi:hypothetical protein